MWGTSELKTTTIELPVLESPRLKMQTKTNGVTERRNTRKIHRTPGAGNNMMSSVFQSVMLGEKKKCLKKP